jgi:hypothetical protein
MGAATQSPPSGREQIDAAHAKLNGGAEGEATDTQSRATAHPDAKAPAPAQELPDGLELDAGGQLSLEVGGKRPTGGTVTLTGGKFSLPKGQFVKGERIVVRVEAIVDKVAFKDQTDAKTRQIVGCERQHEARITGTALLNANEEPAAAPEVDRSQALGRVIAVLNEQNMTADEFVADQLVSAVLSG